MRPEELRLGNWVIRPERFGNDAFECQVQEIAHDSARIGHTLQSSIWCIPEPIELTEEWLKRFGFEKHKRTSFSIFVKRNDFGPIALRVVKPPTYKGFLIEWAVNNVEATTIGTVDKVHDLQNLWWSLIREELKEVAENPKSRQ